MSVVNAVKATNKPLSAPTPPLLLQRKCACGGSPGIAAECAKCQSKRLLGKPLQAKLRIGEPDDEYEREADRVAEEVMRMPDAPANTAGPISPAVSPRVRRCVTQDSPTGVQAVPQVVHDVLSSPGQPLDSATRAFFEPRFGYDFGHVRVHSDARAAQSARTINAAAYTAGNHVVVDTGPTPPQRLLGHELTHVIQQQAAPGNTPVIQRLSLADFVPDVLENAAESAARQALAALGSFDQSTIASGIEHALRLPGVGSYIAEHPLLAPHRKSLDLLLATPGALRAIWDFIEHADTYSARFKTILLPHIEQARQLAVEQGDALLTELGVPQEYHEPVWQVLKYAAGLAQGAFSFVLNDIIADTVLFWQLRSEREIYQQAWDSYAKQEIDGFDLMLEYLAIVLNVVGRVEDLMPLILIVGGLAGGGAAGGTAGSVAPVAGTAAGGGAGAGAGGAGGMAISEIVGLGLSIAPAALEGTKFFKAGADLGLRDQTEQQRQHDFGQLAASAFSLLVIGALAFLPGLAMRAGRGFARKLKEMLPDVGSILQRLDISLPSSVSKQRSTPEASSAATRLEQDVIPSSITGTSSTGRLDVDADARVSTAEALPDAVPASVAEDIGTPAVDSASLLPDAQRVAAPSPEASTVQPAGSPEPSAVSFDRNAVDPIPQDAPRTAASADVAASSDVHRMSSATRSVDDISRDLSDVSREINEATQVALDLITEELGEEAGGHRGIRAVREGLKRIAGRGGERGDIAKAMLDDIDQLVRRRGELQRELHGVRNAPRLDGAVSVTQTLPALTQEQKSLLIKTGDPREYPAALPRDLADQELDIVRKSEAVSLTNPNDGYVREVDLGNGHKWKGKEDGTWCRFSSTPTNCTPVGAPSAAASTGEPASTALVRWTPPDQPGQLDVAHSQSMSPETQQPAAATPAGPIANPRDRARIVHEAAEGLLSSPRVRDAQANIARQRGGGLTPDVSGKLPGAVAAEIATPDPRSAQDSLLGGVRVHEEPQERGYQNLVVSGVPDYHDAVRNVAFPDHRYPEAAGGAVWLSERDIARALRQIARTGNLPHFPGGSARMTPSQSAKFDELLQQPDVLGALNRAGEDAAKRRRRYTPADELPELNVDPNAPSFTGEVEADLRRGYIEGALGERGVALDTQLKRLAYLLFVRESARDPANLVHIMMTVDLIAAGRMGFRDALDSGQTFRWRTARKNALSPTRKDGQLGYYHKGKPPSATEMKLNKDIAKLPIPEEHVQGKRGPKSFVVTELQGGLLPASPPGATAAAPQFREWLEGTGRSPLKKKEFASIGESLAKQDTLVVSWVELYGASADDATAVRELIQRRLRYFYGLE